MINFNITVDRDAQKPVWRVRYANGGLIVPIPPMHLATISEVAIAMSLKDKEHPARTMLVYHCETDEINSIYHEGICYQPVMKEED